VVILTTSVVAGYNAFKSPSKVPNETRVAAVEIGRHHVPTNEMRMIGRLGLAAFAVSTMVVGCGRIGYTPIGLDSDASDVRTTSDGSLADAGAEAGKPTDGRDAGDATLDSPIATDTAADSAPDKGPASSASCLDLLHAGAAADGVYTIDVDGPAGPIAPAAVYCDMSFDGGGWTMIESYDGTHAPRNFAADDGTTPFLTAAPRPLTLGALGSLLLDPLIADATQVHIRNSFVTSAQNADPTTGWFATSRAPAANEVTIPIANLRIHHVLNDGTNGGAADWTGPRLANLTWMTASACTVATPRYPDIYWACDNVMGLHITNDAARWDYSATAQQTMEVFVRRRYLATW